EPCAPIVAARDRDRRSERTGASVVGAGRSALQGGDPVAPGHRRAAAAALTPSFAAGSGVDSRPTCAARPPPPPPPPPPRGPAHLRFLTLNSSRSVSTLASDYAFVLDWTLSGQTLTAPGLKHAQLAAADADIAGAETNLITAVTQQYLTVLQARDNAAVARK